MASPETIYIMSHNIIEVTGVMNAATDTFLNGADVTLTLLDTVSGEAIVGQTWPLALTYIAGSDGDYRGTILDSIELSANQNLMAEVIVDAGAGLKRYWQRPCIARIGD